MTQLADKITEKIYLGQFDAHKDISFLKERNIGAILAVISDFYIEKKHEENLIENLIDIKHIYVEDIEGFDIDSILNEAHRYIDKYVSNNINILVCCRKGISRSATVVLSYLMTRQNKTLADAINHVRKKRSIINPNLGFMVSLTNLDEILKDTREKN